MPITRIWFSFHGRIPRSTYWLKSILPTYAALAVLNIGLSLFAGSAPFLLKTVATTLGILLIAVLGAIVAGAVKRSHDCGRGFWFLLLFVVPILSIWPFIELGFREGTKGENRFGADPRMSAADAIG